MIFPAHLKLSAVGSVLGAPPSGTGGPSVIDVQARSIRSPLYLKAWRPVAGALAGVGEASKWIWQMVCALVRRIARMFGLEAKIPDTPPEGAEPAAELSVPASQLAAGADPVQAARNLAAGAGAAGSQADAFLAHLLDGFPDRDALKGMTAPAFLTAALDTLGGEIQQRRLVTSAAADALQAGVQRVADELGVSAQDVARHFISNTAGPQAKEVRPLWEAFDAARRAEHAAAQQFCNYCIAAMRGPAGPLQEEVDEAARRALTKYGDTAMIDRVEQGVNAPSLEAAVQFTDVPPPHDPVQASTHQAFAQDQGGQADSPDAAQQASAAAPGAAASPRVSSLLERFRRAGALDETPATDDPHDNVEGAARPVAA